MTRRTTYDQLREVADRLWEEGVTDIEMTKLCAEAMGIKVQWRQITERYWMLTKAYPIDGEPYDPLHNDAQAMALVKKFRLTVVWTDARLDGWRVRSWRTGKTGALCEEADADDLNRAIVECVAKLQSAA